MLILISDIHFSDGTTSSNVKKEAFDILKEEIKKCANDTDNQVKEVHLLLLGDIFDLVRTDYWLKLNSADRPWYGKFNREKFAFETSRSESDYNTVLENIFNCKDESCVEFFNVINKLRNEEPTNKIDFKVTYVIGNHDQAINIYDSLKDKIREKIEGIEFKNEYSNPDYTVFARHGHEYDSECYSLKLYNEVLNKKDKRQGFDEDIYKITSIGEVITAEFMSGLIHYVIEELKQAGLDDEDKDFIKNLKEANNVRPVLSVFRWLSWFTERKDDVIENIKKSYLINIESSLKKAIKGLLGSEIAKKWKKTEVCDITFKFKFGLFVFNIIGIKAARWFVNIISHPIFKKIKLNFKKDKYLNGAADDSKKIKHNSGYVFYGHTHDAKHKFIQGNPDGSAVMYINTGTFLPYIEEGYRRRSFASSNQMTIAIVYRIDEDMSGGKENLYPTLELWNGNKRKKYLSN